MTIFQLFLLAMGVLVALPMISYLIVKWGCIGYFSAKDVCARHFKEKESVNDKA